LEGALKSFENAISANAKRRMRSRHLSLAYRKQWFFGMSAKVVQIMASQIAEFFCGVIYIVVEWWRPLWDALSWVATRFFQQGNHKRHNIFSKGFAGTTAFPNPSTEPGSASALSETRKRRLWGEDTASQSFAIYGPQPGLSSEISNLFFDGLKIFAAQSLRFGQ